MNELRELYQELVLDHGKKPRNYRPMDEPYRHSVGYNPVCGDKLSLFVRVNESDVVEDVSFQGTGCAISTASASLLTEALKGKTATEAMDLMRQFTAMLIDPENDTDPDALGKLAVFEGVKDFPVRVKCATLAWRTLEAALDGRDTPVTTE